MPDSVPYLSAELLERIADGDEAAFAELYALYAPRLYVFAIRLTHSTSNAEEILQETFLSLWLHRDALSGIEHLNAWIYKVAARHCLQWMRRQKSEQQRLNRLPPADTAVTIATPADIVHWQELQQAVQNALHQLPEVRQQIYRINREEGLKPAAIALRLQMPVGTVKNHLSLAVRAVREHLVREGYHFTLLFCTAIATPATFFLILS